MGVDILPIISVEALNLYTIHFNFIIVLIPNCLDVFNKATEKKEFSCGLFQDLSKAFDTDPRFWSHKLRAQMQLELLYISKRSK